jgi:acetoin utilization protein AcuB
MFVRDYMTPDPKVVYPDINFPEAVQLMRKHNIRRLPVVEDGQLVGIVVEKDLLTNQPSPATTLSVHEIYSLMERLRVRQIMTQPVITVEGDCPVEEAARIMVENKIGCLPIMQGETLVGIITETDIFKVLVEVLGGQESGCRLTLNVPERVGELARISTLIAEAGGNILAATSSRVLRNNKREVMIKISGVEAAKVEEQIGSAGAEIVDVRASARYQPRLFG